MNSDERTTDSRDGSREPAPEQHDDDGLDLAKALTRATAKSTPQARTKQRRRDQRPTRGRVSGSHPDDRDPQTLDSTLGRLVADHGWALDLRVQGVFGRWPELVGAEVAEHCTPESFADGRLVVRTDSTAWATQLQAAHADRRTAPQRGARPRDRHGDRGGRAAPADLEEGTPFGARRTRSARHLRLRSAEPLTDALGAASTYGDPSAPLFGRSGATHEPLTATICPQTTPSWGSGRGMRRSDGYYGHRPPASRAAAVSMSTEACEEVRVSDDSPVENPPTRPPPFRPHPPRRRSSTTPPRSRSSRASRRSASGRACTSARPVSAACTT